MQSSKKEQLSKCETGDKQSGNCNDKKKYWKCKEKGHILVKDCPNKQKDQADAFFIGMSLDEE